MTTGDPIYTITSNHNHSIPTGASVGVDPYENSIVGGTYGSAIGIAIGGDNYTYSGGTYTSNVYPQPLTIKDIKRCREALHTNLEFPRGFCANPVSAQ